MHGYEICAHKVQTYKTNACEMHGYEVYDHAHKVYAHKAYAYEVIVEESEMKPAIKDEPLKELEDIIGRR